MTEPAKRVNLNEKIQKSLWLTLRTRKAYDRMARKRDVRPAELMRQALNEWAEANK